jgi:hypothetical protein
MAFTSNRNLTSSNTVALKDWQHAYDTFATDQFRLAPKQKFLFHVAFGINTNCCYDTTLVQKYGNEINLLVKSVDLPQFSIKTETVNQYNRKKNIQYTHTPMEIGIKFHDDNMGLINHMWQNYYNYYYADPSSATVPGAYNRTATENSNFIPANYGLDNGSTIPFFNYIYIYQMARHEYVQYSLVNPLVTLWNHNKLDYSQGGQTHDFDMRLKYEAVSYSVGEVNSQNIQGFGSEHYDTSPSSLSGINPDPTVIDPSFVQALDIESAASSILNNAISTVTGYEQRLLSSNISGTGGSFGLTTSTNNTGGLSGITFPIK